MSYPELRSLETEIRTSEKLVHSGGIPYFFQGLSSEETRRQLLENCKREIKLNNELLATLLQEQQNLQSQGYLDRNVNPFLSPDTVECLSPDQVTHVSTRVHICNLRLKYLYKRSLFIIDQYESYQMRHTQKRSSPDDDDDGEEEGLYFPTNHKKLRQSAYPMSF